MIQNHMVDAIVSMSEYNRFSKGIFAWVGYKTHYIPYTVLSAMTVPACFYATGNTISAMVGFLIAVIAAFFERTLIQVAALSCAGVLVTELIINYL